ncbi:response regulator [Phreatobacter sp.]|uniref:response regulator n=1 Tax=Phreatobacter sp. TaxID=1966341 RepID=UPI003F7076F0
MDIEAAVMDHLGDRTEIIVTNNLREAQGLAADAVHCALLDVDVIGGKTFDLARELRQRGTPFAFVSGSLPSDLPEELSGAAFVRKPFRPRDIVGFVSTALVQQEDGHLHMPPAGEGEGAGAP